MILLCLITTLAIYVSYHYALFLRGGDGILHRVLSASLLTCAQIILTELSLGLLHGLYLPVVLVVNIAVSAIVVMAAQRRGAGRLTVALRNDALRIWSTIASARDVPVLVLGTLALLTYGWIVIAAYYLPPRGVDDLAYHLAAVFEYVRSHEIRLLPIGMQPFAYPENAELLFLWPVLFTHAQRWVDAANVLFVLLSVMTIFALCRHFLLPRKDSLFAALLFALCPVVLMQAGVNYVDIIVSLFLMMSLYYALRYREHRRTGDLYLTGLATGLMCGMKYTAPFLALPLQVLILPALIRGRRRHVLGYLTVIAFAGSWWYIRNAYVLGNPLFPVHFQASVPDGLVNLRGGSVLQNIRYNLPYWVARYPLADSGVGSFDGGFGTVFWGMGCISWIYVAGRSLFSCRCSESSRLVLLSYLPIGFLLLLTFPPRVVDFNGRLALFVVAVGLFSFTEVLQRIDDRLYSGILKGMCIVLSMSAVSLLAVSDKPLYRVGAAVDDAGRGADPSQFKYLSESIPLHRALRPAWELLDLLTRDPARGLNCYVASDFPLFSPAPVFGSRLQNRVLNLSRAGAGPVDAYVCTFLDRNNLSNPFVVPPSGRDPRGDDARSIDDVLRKPGYIAAEISNSTALLLRKDVFDRPEEQRILGDYYRAEWPAAVTAARELEEKIDGDIPIITSGEIGYGLRVIDFEKGRPDRTKLTLAGWEKELASRDRVRRCYTIGSPLEGYRSRRVARIFYKGQTLDVYLNRRP